MIHLVGDLQGCDAALQRLLDEIGFSPSRDRVVLLGDLVNRGPASLAVLRRLAALGDAAVSLLGNHDLHLLAVAEGVRPMHRGDTLDEALAAPDRTPCLEWLRAQRLADVQAGWLCVHAGVVPQWDAGQTLQLAGEVQALLRGPDASELLRLMYGIQPALWHDSLAGPERWRFIINTLTRIRFCSVAGELDLQVKEGPGDAPPGLLPWFEVPGRRTAEQPMAFGHWSALGLVNQPMVLALDTGCVWGGALTAVRVDGGRREVCQVSCAGAQQAGN